MRYEVQKIGFDLTNDDDKKNLTAEASNREHLAL